MNGPEHYLEAERLIAEAHNQVDNATPNTIAEGTEMAVLAAKLAHVHAMLAVAAAQAAQLGDRYYDYSGDAQEWLVAITDVHEIDECGDRTISGL